MRILALVTDAYGGYGGIAQYNRDLLSALALSGVVGEVVVLPRIAEPEFQELPEKIRQLAPCGGRVAYTARSVEVTRRYGPFDVIFIGHLYHAPLAVVLGRWLKSPLWLQTHGSDAWECPARLVRVASERSRLITAVSRYTRHRLLAWAGIAPEKVRVLSNTFRPMFTPGPRDEACLARLGLTGAKVILTASRLGKADSYKGHRLVIDTLPRLLKRHPEARYVIVGDGEARADLEAYAVGRGVRGSVMFLGRMRDADVLQLYRSSDVFVMPSTREGFGIVFVEAAATGLPVIGGNRDGSTDALADGVIGTMIDPGDHDALAGALEHALSGPAKMDSQAAQRFAFRNFASHVDALVRDLSR